MNQRLRPIGRDWKGEGRYQNQMRERVKVACGRRQGIVYLLGLKRELIGSWRRNGRYFVVLLHALISLVSMARSCRSVGRVEAEEECGHGHRARE